MGGAQQVFVREPGARPEHGWRVLGTWLTTLLFSALRLARLPHPSSSPGGGGSLRVAVYCSIVLQTFLGSLRDL